MLGRKNIISALLAVALLAGAANLGWSQSGTVGDIELFKEVKKKEASGNIGRWSAEGLYRSHEENALRYEKEFGNKIFILYGTIKEVRLAYNFEKAAYIIELETGTWSLDNIRIAYPKNISESKKNEILSMKKGQLFEATVFGCHIESYSNESFPYVHIFYYNQDGVAMTEL